MLILSTALYVFAAILFCYIVYRIAIKREFDAGIAIGVLGIVVTLILATGIKPQLPLPSLPTPISTLSPTQSAFSPMVIATRVASLSGTQLLHDDFEQPGVIMGHIDGGNWTTKTRAIHGKRLAYKKSENTLAKLTHALVFRLVYSYGISRL